MRLTLRLRDFPRNERTQLMMQYYMTTPEAQAIAAQYMPQVIDTSKLGETISQVLVPQITQAVATQLAPKLAEAISTQMVPVLTQAIATEVSQQMSKMISQQLVPQIQKQVQATMTTYMTQVADVLATQTQAAVEDAMSGMMENMGDASRWTRTRSPTLSTSTWIRKSLPSCSCP